MSDLFEPVTPAADPTPPAVDPGLPLTSDHPPADHAPVDPARAAAGRRGGERFHQLARLGRQYEQEHGLTAGRQRLKQLVQLGRRYEQEHGVAAAPRRRRTPGDPVAELLTALARVVKPAYRPAVERLIDAVRQPVPAAEPANLPAAAA